MALQFSHASMSSQKPNKMTFNLSSRIFHLVLITVLGLTVYSTCLNGDFLWDDHGLVKHNNLVRDISNIGKAFQGPMGSGIAIKDDQSSKFIFYRPLQAVSFMIDHRLWGPDSFGFHLTNVVLHILSALALYWFVALVFADLRLSFIVSVLFVVHPVHTDAVSYISGRADPLALTFILLTLIFYLKYSRLKKPVFLVLMLVAYALAILSKETSLIVIGLILAHDFFLAGKLNIKTVLPFLPLILFYIILKTVIFQQHLPPPGFYQEIPERIPGFFLAIFEYIRLIFLPINLHMDYGLKVFEINNPRALAGVVIVIGLLVHLFRKRRTDPLYCFAVLWFFLTLMPVANIFFPLHFFMAEHYLYLPSIGIFLVVGRALPMILEKVKAKKAALGLFVLVVVLLGGLTIRQNLVWADPIRFYRNILEYSPDSSDTYNNMGNLYAVEGRYDEAIEAYEKAIEISPRSYKAYANLGNTLRVAGQKEKALAMLKKSIEIQPIYALGHYKLSVAYYDLGRFKPAVIHHDEAIRLGIRPDPGYSESLKQYR